MIIVSCCSYKKHISHRKIQPVKMIRSGTLPHKVYWNPQEGSCIPREQFPNPLDPIMHIPIGLLVSFVIPIPQDPSIHTQNFAALFKVERSRMFHNTNLISCNNEILMEFYRQFSGCNSQVSHVVSCYRPPWGRRLLLTETTAKFQLAIKMNKQFQPNQWLDFSILFGSFQLTTR